MIYEFNKIYNIDCMEFMKNIPDNYFDHIITDIPYEIYSNEYNLSKIGNEIDYKYFIKANERLEKLKEENVLYKFKLRNE